MDKMMTEMDTTKKIVNEKIAVKKMEAKEAMPEKIATETAVPSKSTEENHMPQKVMTEKQAPKPRMFGYVRVSTREQNEDRQLIALNDFHVPGENIYIDKQSGKDFDRPQYQRLLKKMKCGDILVVKSIDRLGRNYDDILWQWRLITKEKNIDIVILDMPLLDTRESGKNLMGKFVADMVLQILSYVAQTERENIHQRQMEGIAAARVRGARFGRPRKEIPEHFLILKEAFEHGEISSRAAAKELDISQDTFLRWVRGE